MGQKFPEITEPLKKFILNQKLYFVASAPLGQSGRVNVSPKGYDTLRLVSSKKLYYVDLTGSGIETVSHMKENGRITLMWISFDKLPEIVRVWGRGRVVEPGSPEFEETVDPKLKSIPGVRAVIIVDVDMTGSSCGYTVPFYEFKGERTVLLDKADKATESGFIKYQSENNMWSQDNLVGLESRMPKNFLWYFKRYFMPSVEGMTLAAERAGWMLAGAALAGFLMPRISRITGMLSN
ncbi:hypothetical protein M427DRAFT_58053 [Gonapodya prolifera JEL478]|uniref:Pyridoxamine 5'-phosphate oxidase N-terminal domain-containing protein n=1 Tax=Gonapodya prolifera (strain JEL478) TaxID=1344416 RepID=A0A139AAI4_GONPJ|nr:hypothetical protein M427DRAFT_58053 [Gonapodya prolifera JEL478]|eukprot:KXS13806.1 hypothetical protein M427DRAFT_58053 [Gonapodya prolifera JEL478]